MREEKESNMRKRAKPNFLLRTMAKIIKSKKRVRAAPKRI
jgi:hypothetical protein